MPENYLNNILKFFKLFGQNPSGSWEKCGLPLIYSISPPIIKLGTVCHVLFVTCNFLNVIEQCFSSHISNIWLNTT